MANPQLEDGYTPVANQILESLIKTHLSSNQWQVLLCIIRRTYGFHKKVDYIANRQIVEATGLCKAVVSRALHDLNDLSLIVRTGKLIGFQKDWEKWGKLAELQTTEKLAVSSTELAESSTKVSSPHVTQNIKYKVSKNRENAKKRSSDPVITEIFDEMRRYLGFPDKTDKDPVPNYGKEGNFIKRMLTRGFSHDEILECWKAKVNNRGGQFVSMVYVNEDIRSKPTSQNALKGVEIEQ